MPEEIKLWSIEGERPKAIPQARLDLESRLEEWLRQDISLVSSDLLVIGQQVPTAYGGSIDLLAIDPVGNLVMLELKKDTTPREVVAQALDYASWIQDLGHDSIQETAKAFIKNKTLEEAFRDNFQTDLPDVLNERHRMYIVASYIDSSTERIVKYLSETHGVDINVATFAYFETAHGEFLARSLLLDETAVQSRAESTSKRKPPLSFEEFRGIAEKKGVVDLYDKVFSELRPLVGGVDRTRTSITFVGNIGESKSRKAILGIYPDASSASDGLAMLCLVDRVSEHFGVSQDELVPLLGPRAIDLPVPVVYPDHVYFFDNQRLEELIELLRRAGD